MHFIMLDVPMFTYVYSFDAWLDKDNIFILVESIGV